MTSSSSPNVHGGTSTSQQSADPPRVGGAPEDPSIFGDPNEELRKAREALPFWKRPAAWWLMAFAPLSATYSTLLTLAAAAQIELYTQLVCCVHRPEFQLASDANFTTPNQIPLTLPRGELCSFCHKTLPPCTLPSFNVMKSGLVASITGGGLPCSSDPATTLIAGILGFLTVGWWGSFSDRHGRTRILGIVAIGQLMCSLNVILVANYVQVLPGNYWFLVVDSIILGAVGGSTASETAAMMAYLSDIRVVPPEQRSRLFGVVLGFFLAGIGIGPMLGSFVIRITQNVLSVFFLAAALRVLQACLALFVLPESLTKAQMQRALEIHQEVSPRGDQPTALWWLKRIFFFLEPLSIFFPSKIVNENSSKVGKRDWNLTFLALGYGLMFLAAVRLFPPVYYFGVQRFALGIHTGPVLYALLTFGWDAEYLGYCISSIGLAQAFYLCLILPFVIHLVKNRAAKNHKHNSEREPLLSDQDTPLTKYIPPKAYILDLTIARLSVLVNVITFAILPWAPTGLIFLVFISLGSFGAGLGPAVNSVALELYSRKLGKNAALESGKLFGAMSVVQAVFAHVLGPPLYGLLYAATVADHPRTIFFVALGNATLSSVLLACVRVTPEVEDTDDVEVA
ncbi:major facilitator superfamily domain-containing protein [Mycena metata]|uniref:Major facilitator superfamily domain-containing protein n=1 Tax=Mycena metata TaxID=1033252 RepID=A0AAD7IZA6_9AGAR|nr:major facilitator superfamily domain-containing protein [Mycena metata]